MRAIRSLTVYFAVIFLGGALVAPWLYWLAQWSADRFPALASLAAQPFHRFVNRALLVLAVAGLWPLLRSVGARSCQDVGLANPTGQWGKLATGFLLGLGSLAVVAVMAISFGAREPNHDHAAAQVAGHLGSAALTAIVVSFIEELVFRGAIFGALRTACSWPVALLASSVIYALTHFLQSADPPGAVYWASGLLMLPRMMGGLGDAHAVVPGLLNLTLAGLLLGLAYQRTGHLFFSMGLHGGWIFWLKTYGFLTVATPDANAWFWGSGKLIDGWLALLILTAVLPLAARLRPTEQRQQRDP